jgi:hypothetical protein
VTTFAYSSGDPTNLTGGGSADMSDISGPFDDIKNFLNGNISDVNIADNGVDNDNLDATTVAAKLGLSQTGTVRRGKSIIATEESRTNTSYGTMTTPDQVSNVVLPTDGLIVIGYMALWKSSVAAAGAAAVFLNSNQLKVRYGPNAAPITTSAATGSTADRWEALGTTPNGITSPGQAASDATSDVTTGQVVGVVGEISGVDATGGVCHIFAAAGTYTVSIQFKSSSGSVTVKERKLWVWSQGF